MKFLVLTEDVPGVPTGRRLLRSEARRVWDLYMKGIVREIYFRPDTKEAVLVFEAKDARAVRTAMKALPLAESGAMTYEVIALEPYDGFSRLFIPEDTARRRRRRAPIPRQK